jgi:hypothetical protein
MALLVALWSLLRFAVFIWSIDGLVKEKYCVDRRARFSDKFLFQVYYEGSPKQ